MFQFNPMAGLRNSQHQVHLGAIRSSLTVKVLDHASSAKGSQQEKYFALEPTLYLDFLFAEAKETILQSVEVLLDVWKQFVHVLTSVVYDKIKKVVF
jgi:hypothetical protein